MNLTLNLATSTNLLCFNEGKKERSMLDIIPLLATSGYHYIDLNFCELMNPNENIDLDYINKLSNYKSEFCLEYIQSHAPYAQDYLTLSLDEKNKIDTLILRAIEYSKILNIETIVIHPIKASTENNVQYFKSLLDKTDGIKFAIENMDREDELSTADELLEIVKLLDSDRIGICFDTGHAHLRGLNLKEEILKYSKYLIATHIQDNRGDKDEHLLPFFGSINWQSVMEAFREISYNKYLTYEIMFFTKYINNRIMPSVLSLTLDVGNELLNL